MSKFNKKHSLVIMSIIMIMSIFSMTAYAATGSQGYAVYRDGVLELEWHAALMDEPNSAYSLPVMHITGPGGTVDWGTWTEFMDKSTNTFQGVYKPNGTISDYSRDNVVAMGRKLRLENLGYTALSQVDHFVTSSSSWVRPEDLWLIRCDGVVEYCYEWYGYRIYGSDTLWDITKGGIANLNHHNIANITPKKQAQNWMTKVQSTKP